MKKARKSDIESRACSPKHHVSHINSSMYFYLKLNIYSFLVSHGSLILLQRATKGADPRKSLPVHLK